MILPPFCVFIHVCVGSHVCVHAYMFAGLCVPVCACMWKTEVNVEHLPQLLSTFVFWRASLTWFLSASLIEPPVFVFPELVLQAQCTQLFYGGAGDLIQVLIPTHKALHRLSNLPSSGIAYLIEWGNELDMVYQRDRTIPNSQEEWHGFRCHYLCHYNHECTP